MEIGHNNPPDPIDEAIAPFLDVIEEAENWLDGVEVENEDQMNAVDVLIKRIRSAKTAIATAEKSATAPLHDAWKSEIARWKPTKDDIETRLKGLVAIVAKFKEKLAAQKEAQRRAAWEKAEEERRKAEEAAAQADAKDYVTQRAAAEAKQSALDAEKAAQAASKDKVKGMRAVTKYEITDHKAALHWIAANDKGEMTAFIEDYVRRNHKSAAIHGVKVWQTKEAF